jgi:hypothetical protein
MAYEAAARSKAALLACVLGVTGVFCGFVSAQATACIKNSPLHKVDDFIVTKRL